MAFMGIVGIFLLVAFGIDAMALKFGLRQSWSASSVQSLILNNVTLVLLPFFAMPFSRFAEKSAIIHMALFSPPAWLLQSALIEIALLRVLWTIPPRHSSAAVLAGNMTGFILFFVAQPYVWGAVSGF